MMERSFRRHRGQVEIRLEPAEVQVIRQVVADLVRRLGGVDDVEPVADPTLRRLFPDGYADDPQSAAELRSLIQDDLRDGKTASAKAVLQSLAELPPSGRMALADDQPKAWLGTLNDLRLTLGTALDVTDDTELDPIGPDGADAFAVSVYYFLGWMQECLVEALAD